MFHLSRGLPWLRTSDGRTERVFYTFESHREIMIMFTEALGLSVIPLHARLRGPGWFSNGACDPERR